MVVRKSGSIAEYAIRRWMQEQNFAAGCFVLTMNGKRGILSDNNGDTLTLVYDSDTRTVYAEDELEVGV